MSDPNSETTQASQARTGRNWLLAGALLVFVVIVFVVTIVKISANVGHH